MTENEIKPERITKPIQLLAAWLLGLIILDSSFLVAADSLGTDTWQSGLLVIAAILNVPIFLLAVFLLQTRFRPELQEDSYYSSYLSNKTNKPVYQKDSDKHQLEILEKIERIESITDNSKNKESENSNASIDWGFVLFGVNQHLENKNEISEILRKYNIQTCTIFGSDQKAKGKNISIAEYLPPDVVSKILEIGKELNFETYNFFNSLSENTVEDVLIGSYGKPDHLIL